MIPTPSQKLAETWRNNLVKVVKRLEHDANNQLTSIYALCDLNSNRTSEDPEVKEGFNSIKSNAHQIYKVMQQMVKLFDTDRDAIHCVAVDAFLGENILLFQSLVGRHAKLVIVPTQAQRFVKVNPSQLLNTIFDFLLQMGRVEKVVFSLKGNTQEKDFIDLELKVNSSDNKAEVNLEEELREEFKAYPKEVTGFKKLGKEYIFTLKLKLMELEIETELTSD